MKKYRLLIAYDGSDCSEVALRDLTSAGLFPRVEALVVCVADVFLPSTTRMDPKLPDWFTEPIQQARQESKEAVDKAYALGMEAAGRIRKAFPGWTVRVEALADTPAWGILKRIHSWKPDLVLLGRHGRSAMGRFFIGSVSQKVLTHAACSVRIVHNQREGRASKPRLIIGFDGSTDAWRAVREVARRPWPSGTVVRLVTALDTNLQTLLLATGASEERGRGKSVDHERRWLQDVMQPAVNHLKGAGLTVQPQIRKGHAKKVLLEEAKAWKPTTLFIGARGLTGMERFLLGSVSTAMTTHAPCSIEVVRRLSS